MNDRQTVKEIRGRVDLTRSQKITMIKTALGIARKEAAQLYKEYA